MNDEIMKKMGFDKEVETKKHSFCPFCRKPVSVADFKDELSKKEYQISGLCQKCQDEQFGGE